MVTLAQELLTRLLPHTPAEAAYARNRLFEERPPWPHVGDRVWYRRNEWDIDDDVHLMVVVDVQDPDDTESIWASNLVQHLRDNHTSQPLHHPDGSPVLVPLPDPLPWVHLRWPAERPIPKGREHNWKHNIQQTWESRMRGSPGWLPHDYRATRKLYLPGQLPEHAMTSYRYVDERLEQLPPGGDAWRPYR